MARANQGRIVAVDAYVAQAAPFARPILKYLRDVVHEAAPGVQEEMKWSRPFFLHHGVILGNMAAFKQHCSLGLWGAEIAAALRAGGAASADGMGTFGRIASLEDLPPAKVLAGYIQQAARAIETGERTKAWTRPKVAKAAVEMPEALTAALGRNKGAAAKFGAMSPSAQREYGEWIGEAKREETRQRRVASAVEWIAEGKSRNWKYERV
jgi:uncharacterized protein YdeI (YjbR/CyaY-like superfamily)